ncbi:hypothetical protein OHT77_15660 [Streptomyces sp. NBC_00252]|uniref:hypothetical protein n=1 Tax=Streptomyces sp. NBC_00252 TaxID=2975691 RepID=UPI002E2D514D|nr:hypothetical protein [Streptomyces sp. NBC_00252]
MALRDAINELADRWEDVEPRLDPEDGRRVIGAMRALAHDDEELMSVIIDHVAPALPRGHSIFAALLIDDTKGDTVRPTWEQVAAKLERIVAKSPW